MADKYVNETGLVVVRDWANGKFALDADLDTLTERVEEIIAEGGEPNVIEVVKRNGTALPVANKAVDVDVPESTSDLTNDGDGTSAFATEDYVDENGGKIDSISVNGTAQTIDANKNVDLTVPTKVSELTNDGDGTQGSAFATEDYVDQNGGKIDVIKVNGTAQTITNKEVNLTVPEDLSDLTNTDADPYAKMSDVESATVGALKPKGSIPFASLPPNTAANLNNMYNITDSFTTTADFIEGAGHAHPAGTNVAIVNVGTDASPSYKYDVFVGITDLSAYWTSTSGQTNSLIAMTTSEINAILNPVTP